MPVQFAPLNVSAKRRRQTLGVLFWILLMPLSLIVYLLGLYCYYTRPLAIVYTIWFLFFDKAHEQGGRRIPFIRRLLVWRWMRDFFPIKLIKESDLDPFKSYIFGYHPHGIISIGAWVNFATEANEFSSLFPGINIRLLTLAMNFNIPVFREMMLGLSIASVSRKSVQCIISKGLGHSVMIVVGGAQESLYSQPGTLDLVLNKRLGFIKVAIQNGTSLIPVLSIGENDVYDLIPSKPGSFTHTIQQACKNTFGFTVPLFFGRGIFNYSFGALPHRRPIVTIVGSPIDPVYVIAMNNSTLSSTTFSTATTTDKGKTPPRLDINSMTEEDLSRVLKLVHAHYVSELRRLWDKYKDEYAKDRIRELRIVE